MSQGLNDFLAEAEEIIEALNQDLELLGAGMVTGGFEPDLLNRIFRSAHSLKGISGMFGFGDISQLAHDMENLLDNLRLGRLGLDAEVLAVLFESVDVLARLVAGKAESEDFTMDLEPILARIDMVRTGGGKGAGNVGGAEQIDPAILAVLTEYEEHRLMENISAGKNIYRITALFSLMTFDTELMALTEALKHAGEVVSTLPCPGEDADQIGFQLILGSGLEQPAIERDFPEGNVRMEKLLGKTAAPKVKKEPQPAAVTREVSSAPVVQVVESEAAEAGASMRSISRTVRVDIDKLDQLMNIVGDLVLAKSSIYALSERLRAEVGGEIASALQKATRTLDRRLEDLQKGVMEVRMVPVAQLFEKMKRVVRRLSMEQHKEISLHVRGEETELDKLIVEELSDPLVHIIRNAIDHGVELPQERKSAGKPGKASIELRAFQKGNHVVIEVEDDGRGINTEKVKEKAVRQGLIRADVDLNRQQIHDLLMTPGFSTRDEVSEVSGRGVGLDVVKSNISSLSGLVEISSTFGKGTCISLTLPITLAIIKALIVKVCGRTYAVPINSVMETLMLDGGQIQTIEKTEVLDLRQSTLPLVRLSRVFALGEESARAGNCFVAVVGMAEKRLGLVVDELLGQQDVVIKSLGANLSFLRGIAGAADLGNQKTILVLDIGGLIEEALRGESSIHV